MSWIKAQFECVDNVRRVGLRLDSISGALLVAGNVRLSDELSLLSSNLLSTANKLSNICSAKVSADLRQSEELTASMLKSVLGGSEKC